MDQNAHDELKRVLASPVFLASPKLSALLQYLATNESPGTLTQSVIASEFFGRGSLEYDPKADSTVRGEVRRLRLKLSEYYMSEGGRSAGRLEIPKGAYEVVWHRSPLPPASSPARYRFVLWAAGILALALGLGFGWKSNAARTPPRAVAVLPFGGTQLSMDVGDDLSRRLTRSKMLRVTALRSTAVFRDRTEPLASIGRKLGIDGVVEGTVERGAGGTFLIEARLKDVRSGRELWSKRVSCAVDGFQRAEDELSAGLLAALEVPAVTPPYHPKSEALNLHIEGLHKMRAPKPDTTAALTLFERAARLDPEFAAPQVAQARIYFVQTNNGQMDPATALPRAEAMVRAALRADPESSEAHTTLGNIYYARHDWQNARVEYETAIELDPSSALAYTSVATLLTILGRFDEAEREFRHAIALDPLWYGPQYALAELHYYARRYDQSFLDAEEFARRFPGMRSELLKSRARRRQGRNAEAAAFVSVLVENHAKDIYRSIYLADYAKAKVMLAGLQSKTAYVSNWSRADMAMELGEREQAMGWLEKALAAGEPDVCSLNVDPTFDAVREHPRCQRILAQLNLRPPAR